MTQIPNRPGARFVTPNVQSVSDHPWLQASNAPAPWGPPSLQPPPPPPSTPSHVPPPPFVAVPVGSSGYDAPAPDSRWHTHLQLGSTPGTRPSARPSAPLAAWLAIAGALFVAVGSFLPWGSFPQAVETLGLPREFSGFTKIGGSEKDGPFFVGMAVIIAAFGITTLLAKRRLPILIIGLGVAAFGAIAAVIDFTDVANVGGDIPSAFEPSPGPGLPIVIAGFALTLAGFVIGLAKRRP